ncbi:MAG TPA: NAD(P)H-binding protein [Jiangellaceae bacterium]
MNVLVFGAGGATGRELVSQALQRGHRVTAFVRSSPMPATDAHGLTTVRGDVRDPDAVAAAVAGHDAVLCALGAATPLRRDPVIVGGLQSIVTATERHGVRRFVYLSFLGVHEGREQLSVLGRWVVAPLIMRNVVADHEAKERIIRATSLDWVIVRPPRLTNGPRRGTYRSGVDIRATAVIPRISRADIADFMLRQLEEDQYVRQTPAVMY